MRYKKISIQEIGSLNRVVDLDIGIPKIRSNFYARLYSLFGDPSDTSYEGYEYFIKDEESNLKFSAALTGFGLGYFAETNDDPTNKILEEFHNFLFAESLKMKDCSLTFEHDFGKTIVGYENGSLVEIDNEE